MPTMQDLLNKPQHLPSVPEVVRELIQTFNQPDPDLLLIADKLSRDPVISAKLLRLANSARFGCSRQIATVKEAAVRLGTDTVRNMVLACSLTGSIKTVPGIDLKYFWAQVFDVAELAKRLAQLQGKKGEEVFTCALLHALGRLIMHLGLPETMVQRICDLEPHKGRAAAEQDYRRLHLCRTRRRAGQTVEFSIHLLSRHRLALQPAESRALFRGGRPDPSGNRPINPA